MTESRDTVSQTNKIVMNAHVSSTSCTDFGSSSSQFRVLVQIRANIGQVFVGTVSVVTHEQSLMFQCSTSLNSTTGQRVFRNDKLLSSRLFEVFSSRQPDIGAEKGAV